MKSPRSIVAGLVFMAAACALAGTTTWNGVPVTTTEIPVTALPVTELRTMDVEIQARSVGIMLDRWMKAYRLLETPALYKGNHFAVRAEAIKRRALKEGVSDAVLAECAAFASELSKAKTTK